MNVGILLGGCLTVKN